MKNSNVYALLISVGDYEAIGLKNLPTYKGDPVLLGTSLTLAYSLNSLTRPFWVALL